MTETASPTFADVLARAEELMDQDQFDQAMELLAGARQGVATEPAEEADLQHYLGVCLANLGRPLEAAASYRKGLARAEEAADEAKQARAHEHLGANLQARQDGAKALTHYETSLRLYQRVGDREGEARCYRSLANTYVDLSDHPAAIRSYAEARKLFKELGDDAGLALCIANSVMLTYQKEGVPPAVRAFRESLEQEACRHYLVLNNFGFLLFMGGELDEAESILTEARDDVAKREVEDDDAALVLLNAGNVLAVRGRLEEAEQALRRAVELFGDFPAGRAIEAAVIPNTTHPDQDLEPILFLDNALKQAAAHANLGAVLSKSGRPEEGLVEVRKAAELDREQAYPWYVLGWIHLALEDEAEATAAFKRARGMAPNVEDLRRALDLVNPYASAKVGRNDPCPCGSGTKFKKCHGR